MTAPFLIRYQTFSSNNSGLIPASVTKSLNALPNFSKWSAAVVAKESVNYIFDAEGITKRMQEMVTKIKGQAK